MIQLYKDSRDGIPVSRAVVEIDNMPWPLSSLHVFESECCFHNSASCPDCGGGMVRLGSCSSCPGCGYQSCGI
jgi:hypothetical protein